MNTPKSYNKILSYDSFISAKSNYISRAINSCEYVGVAEALLSMKSLNFDEEQVAILEFISYKKLNPNDWSAILINEGWFEDASKWFSDKILKPASGVVKGAIDWAIELGSSIWDAINGVVDKIMDTMENVWDMVKIETQKWYAGNKSIKRQMTMEINSKTAELKESLSESDVAANELSLKAMNILNKEVELLSNIFVQTVGKVIGGNVFASKITQSLKKSVVNESNDDVQDFIKDNLAMSLLTMVPNAIKEGSLDIKKILKSRPSGIITSFSKMPSINEGIEIIDKFYEYAFKALDLLPPFNMITKFTEDISKDPNEALNMLSKFLSDNFGIPGPYKFELLGSVFSIVIVAAIDFAKYYLIDFIVAQLANFVIPGSGAVIMWLLSIYAIYIVAESVYNLIQNQGGGEQSINEPATT